MSKLDYYSITSRGTRTAVLDELSGEQGGRGLQVEASPEGQSWRLTLTGAGELATATECRRTGWVYPLRIGCSGKAGLCVYDPSGLLSCLVSVLLVRAKALASAPMWPVEIGPGQ